MPALGFYDATQQLEDLVYGASDVPRPQPLPGPQAAAGYGSQPAPQYQPTPQPGDAYFQSNYAQPAEYQPGSSYSPGKVEPAPSSGGGGFFDPTTLPATQPAAAPATSPYGPSGDTLNSTTQRPGTTPSGGNWWDGPATTVSNAATWIGQQAGILPQSAAAQPVDEFDDMLGEMPPGIVGHGGTSGVRGGATGSARGGPVRGGGAGASAPARGAGGYSARVVRPGDSPVNIGGKRGVLPSNQSIGAGQTGSGRIRVNSATVQSSGRVRGGGSTATPGTSPNPTAWEATSPGGAAMRGPGSTGVPEPPGGVGPRIPEAGTTPFPATGPGGRGSPTGGTTFPAPGTSSAGSGAGGMGVPGTMPAGAAPVSPTAAGGSGLSFKVGLGILGGGLAAGSILHNATDLSETDDAPLGEDYAADWAAYPDGTRVLPNGTRVRAGIGMSGSEDPVRPAYTPGERFGEGLPDKVYLNEDGSLRTEPGSVDADQRFAPSRTVLVLSEGANGERGVQQAQASNQAVSAAKARGDEFGFLTNAEFDAIVADGGLDVPAEDIEAWRAALVTTDPATPHYLIIPAAWTPYLGASDVTFETVPASDQAVVVPATSSSSGGGNDWYGNSGGGSRGGYGYSRGSSGGRGGYGGGWDGSSGGGWDSGMPGTMPDLSDFFGPDAFNSPIFAGLRNRLRGGRGMRMRRGRRGRMTRGGIGRAMPALPGEAGFPFVGRNPAEQMNLDRLANMRERA